MALPETSLLLAPKEAGYDQLDLRGLLHRQVGGLLALEDATGVDAGQVGRVLPTATVARSWCGGSEQIGRFAGRNAAN